MGIVGWPKSFVGRIDALKQVVRSDECEIHGLLLMGLELVTNEAHCQAFDMKRVAWADMDGGEIGVFRMQVYA